ncbi:MAG: carbohydrate ABC transporter permease [Gaiellaceae bacterium]|jgi:multiple sugar transport system permease protein
MAFEPPAPPLAAVEELASGGPVAAGTTVAAGIPGRARSERVQRLIAYTAMFAIAVLFFVPFLWSLSTSLKPLPETAHFSLLPHTWTIAGYREALTQYNFGRYMANSAIVSAAVTFTSVFLASLGGYAFARLRFPGRNILFFIVLGTLMIPDQLRLVPLYRMLTIFPLTHWNLIDTYQGYWAIRMVSAGALFLMRQYFLTIPRDLEEAAKLDGAGYFKTFWRVMLPLAGPALAAVAILEFQGTWNDFFWANLILQSPPHWTIQVGVAQFSFTYGTLWNDLMAASMIALAPVVLVYLFFQRYFVAGVASAGVKG